MPQQQQGGNTFGKAIFIIAVLAVLFIFRGPIAEHFHMGGKLSSVEHRLQPTEQTDNGTPVMNGGQALQAGQAKVTDDKAGLYSTPGNDQFATVPLGQLVELTGQVDKTYVQIRYGGFTGWMKRADLQMNRPQPAPHHQ